MPIILVVDNEPPIRSLIALALQREGYSVLTAGSGTSALAIAESLHNQIALLITDVSMPGMNGPTLAEALLPDHPGMRVLFLSARYHPHSADEFEGAEFLAKPFSIEILVAKVRSLLEAAVLRPAV
jgi:DNA-binding response OmpR family regulator